MEKLGMQLTQLNTKSCAATGLTRYDLLRLVDSTAYPVIPNPSLGRTRTPPSTVPPPISAASADKLRSAEPLAARHTLGGDVTHQCQGYLQHSLGEGSFSSSYRFDPCRKGAAFLPLFRRISAAC